jgi:hypothetical protein
MKAVRGLVSDLVERRLWPVALLLLAGVVATPVVLAKGGPSEQAAAPPPASAPALAGSGSSVVVDEPGAADPRRARKLVGRLKDPFASAGLDGGAKQSGSRTPGSVAPVAPSGPPSPTPAPGAPGGGSVAPPSSGGGIPTPQPVLTYTYWTADLRMTRAGRPTAAAKRNAPRYLPLPSPGKPAVLFAGVLNHGRSAGFLVSSFADVEGGTCRPRRSQCGLLQLKPGSTATIAVADAQGHLEHYHLELLHLDRHTTTDAAEANRMLQRVSTEGLCVLQGAGGTFGALIVDPEDGSYTVKSPASSECVKTAAGRRARARGGAWYEHRVPAGAIEQP